MKMGNKQSMMLDREMGLPRIMKSKMNKMKKESAVDMESERYRPYTKSGRYRGESLSRRPKAKMLSMREM